MASDSQPDLGDRAVTFGMQFYAGRWYDVSDVAFSLRLKTADLTAEVKAGRLVARRIADSALVDGADVNAWLESLPSWAATKQRT
jgi:hypothetical protein